jgi:hypothetical protein
MTRHTAQDPGPLQSPSQPLASIEVEDLTFSFRRIRSSALRRAAIEAVRALERSQSIEPRSLTATQD